MGSNLIIIKKYISEMMASNALGKTDKESQGNP